MPKELFNQSQVDTLADSDRLAAGVPGRLHGLRKAGATIAAEGGATTHQLMAMFGWKSLDEAELYTREAARRGLARTAAGHIGNAFLPHPVPNPPAPESKPLKTRKEK
jgi:hypothetical protein